MAKVTAKDAVMVIGLAIGGIVVGIDKTDGSMDIKNPKAPVVHTKITEIGKHRHPTIRANDCVDSVWLEGDKCYLAVIRDRGGEITMISNNLYIVPEPVDSLHEIHAVPKISFADVRKQIESDTTGMGAFIDSTVSE